jgi:hypothetical protein
MIEKGVGGEKGKGIENKTCSLQDNNFKENNLKVTISSFRITN